MKYKECPAHMDYIKGCKACEYELKCFKNDVKNLVQSMYDFKCVRCEKPATTRDLDGYTVCSTHKGKPKCLKCNRKMTKRQNRKTKSYFWGCSKFPDCRFTLNLDWKTSNNPQNQSLINSHPLVSKESEDDVKFIKNKWYVLKKPKNDTVVTHSGKLVWVDKMDQYDGAIVQVGRKMSEDKSVAFFEDCHSYAFHLDWTEGPFETKEDALRSRIKVHCKVLETWEDSGDIMARVEIPPEAAEKLGFGGYADRIQPGTVMEVVRIDENDIHLLDTTTGVVTIVSRTELETEVPMSKKLPKYMDRWKNKSVVTPEAVEAVKAYQKKVDRKKSKASEKVEQQPPFMPEAEFKKLEERLQAEVEARFASLEKKDKEELEKKVDDTTKKFDNDIDRIFNEYHERNRRREELNKRITTELGKDKAPKRRWKNPVILTGCFSAILSSAYVLYPYVHGIIQEISM